MIKRIESSRHRVVLGLSALVASLTFAGSSASQSCGWSEQVVLPSAGFGPRFSPVSADVDGDGDPDLINLSLLTANAVLEWRENTGGVLQKTGMPIHTEYLLRAFVPGDLDGDGDLDVAFSTFGEEDPVFGSTPSKLGWMENLSGDGLNWQYHTIRVGTVASSCKSLCGYVVDDLADIDGDGDLDVLASFERRDGFGYWYENLGSGNSWAEHVLPRGHSALAGDSDQDGDIDLFVRTLDSGTNSQAIYLLENAGGSGTSWIQHTVHTQFFTSMLPADLNGDGHLDLLLMERYGLSALMNPAGSGAQWGSSVSVSVEPDIRAMAAADIDGDGDIDVVGGMSSGTKGLYWYENRDGSGTNWWADRVSPSYRTDSIVSLDMEGDGDLDLIAVSTSDYSMSLFTSTTLKGVEVVRIGSPPNVGTLSPGLTSSPAIGRNWDPVVTPFMPGALLDFVAISFRPPLNIQFPFGTLLCDPGPGLRLIFALPGTPFSIPFANNCSLAGRRATAQGGSFKAGPTIALTIALTNALDIVIGTH